MATIKDIARAAGVSHATVSNVLNHKGNVSAQKVKRVQDAARAMGYRVNEAASALRSGRARVLAVILPDPHSAACDDLYQALCGVARARDYSVMLRLTDNVPERERRAIADALSARAECVLAVSSLPKPREAYEQLRRAGARVAFALRDTPEEPCFAGYDLAAAARAIAARVLAQGASRVGLMTNMTTYPAEAAFKRALCEALAGRAAVQCVESIAAQYSKQTFAFFAPDGAPDAVVTTDEEMAQAVLRAGGALGRASDLRVYCLAPKRLLPPAGYARYALNYRRLGRLLGERLLSDAPQERVILPADGFSSDGAGPPGLADGEVRMLAIDNPCTAALERLSPRIERETGLRLRVVTLPTDAVSRAFAHPETLAGFDLARMDIALMDRYARETFEPLAALGLPSEGAPGLVPGLMRAYGQVGETAYALPLDPSCQILFYRQDLFDDPHLQRGYFETYRAPLAVPGDYDAYVQAAAFFQAAGPGDVRRGALITHRASECMADLTALSADGRFPALSLLQLRAFVARRRALESAAGADEGNWSEAVSRFAQGEYAMMIAHANYAERLSRHPLSQAAGRIGYAPVPGGRPLLGGGAVGVLRASGRKAQAAHLLAALYGAAVSPLLALLSGCSPCAAAYEDEEILAVYPWLSTVRAGFETGVRRKLFPGAKPPFNQLETERRIARICRAAVRSEQTCEDALAQISALLPSRA